MGKGSYISRTGAESTTLKEALTRYLSEITPTKKGATQETDRIKAWMEHPLGRRYLATIRSADMAAYRDERLAKGCNPSTVRNELNIISHLFNVAKKEWGMESLINPIQNIRMPKMPPGRDRRLEEGEEEALLKAADYPLKQMIIIALETGMRLGEILNLRHDDLNLISGRLFPGISNSTISHRFRKLCSDVEIENLRFHDLRHEATSRLFEKGLDMMEVATITGHKTLQMLRRYTHLRAEDLAKKLG